MSDTALHVAQETIEMLIKRIAELQAEVERLREQLTHLKAPINNR